MAVGDLITDNFEVEYGGVLFGGNQGREIVTMDIFTMPTLRTNDVPRPQADGEFIGDDYYGVKRFAMEVEVWGLTASDLQARLHQLLGATSRRSLPEELVVRLEGWSDDLLLFARPIRRSNVLNVETVVGHMARFAVEWRASDPIIYTKNETTVSLTIGDSGEVVGGSFDAAFNYSFGGVGASGVGSLVNTGNAEVNATIEVTGPVTNPNFIFVGPAGETTVFALIGTVEEGDTLVISTQNRTIVLNGVSVYSWLTEPDAWFTLAPGTTQVTFQGDVPGGASTFPTAEVSWRSGTV